MAPSMRRGRGFHKQTPRSVGQHYSRRSSYKNRELKRLKTGYTRRSPAKIPRFKGQHDRLYQEPYFRDSSVSSEIFEDGATPRAGNRKNRIDVIDVPSESERGSSVNSSVSTSFTEATSAVDSVNCTMALLKRKSLVQIINNYIRAGIEEGKRRAKQYIRKALSFGVKSGYLIPADQQGQVLHVSPALSRVRRAREKEREKVRESRKKRRRARRGEGELDLQDRKAMRRGASPRAAPSRKQRDASADVATPAKRKRREPRSRKTKTETRQGNGRPSLEIPIPSEPIKAKRARQRRSQKVMDKPTHPARQRSSSKRQSGDAPRKSAERSRGVSSGNKNEESGSSRDREPERRKDENRAELGPIEERSELPAIPYDVPRTPDEEKDSQDDDEEVNCGAESNDQETWLTNAVECGRETGGDA